jgi:uncharacterized protein YecT (DUF1311 family)
MYEIKLICSSLLLILPSAAFATSAIPTPSERTLRLECGNAFFSQADVHDCLAEKAEDSLKKLRESEKETVAALSKWVQDEKYITYSKARLAASNLEFIKYRDLHCKFMTSLGGSAIGNALEIGRLACVAELNYRRAQQLRDAVLDVPSTLE